ncbi:MAG: CoA protein activase [Limnochordia bacterium]|jgi:predicted nucleotide-binding protein (sugar kinase/HSP70/actin superfamily)
MKITFPHMGSSDIAIVELLRGFGNEVIPPPPPTKRTLDLGTRYAPEFACLPFKILLGTYLEAIEMGADTIISSGGVGPCRAGYYLYLQDRILKDLGYDVQTIVLEPPRGHFVDLLRKIKGLINVPWSQAWRTIRLAWGKLHLLDHVEERAYYLRPREMVQGMTTQVMKKCFSLIEKAADLKELREARHQVEETLNSIPLDPTAQPLKVGIIGEIYVVLEPFSNGDVAETLGELGVEVDRSIYLTSWTKENAFLDFFRIEAERDAQYWARPYLQEKIGGHGIVSVGKTVMYARDGYHGVVHLAPFTCIPEIVAKGILAKVSADHNIPVLTLYLDEHTGKEGVRTRLEAFVDLIRFGHRQQVAEGPY